MTCPYTTKEHSAWRRRTASARATFVTLTGRPERERVLGICVTREDGIMINEAELQGRQF